MIERMSDVEMSVCLGMDAFRILTGRPTRNFTPEQVATALRISIAVQGAESHAAKEKTNG